MSANETADDSIEQASTEALARELADRISDRNAGAVDGISEALSEMDDRALARFRRDVNQVSKALDNLRKDAIDQEILTRMNARGTESLHGLSLIERSGHYLAVADDTFAGMALNRGVPPTEFMKVRTSDAVDVIQNTEGLDADDLLGEWENTHVRG